MPQKNRKGWERGRRNRQVQQIRQILIICEDEKSSRDYFAAFPHDSEEVVIECVGTGKNTDSLMEDALSRKANDSYESIWVVFDKDDFPLQNFNRAFDLASNHNDVYVCWSNECFELWYLLHFQYQNTGLGREQIYEKLNEKLEATYNKADDSMYEQMRPFLETGLENAKRLAFRNEQEDATRKNPSTSVHELVELLLSVDPDHAS